MKIPVINIPMSAMDYFPLPEARPDQERVIPEIEKAFLNGYSTVLLEAPVGSGKSAIALSLALHYGSSHILTPRKSLQDQYYEDFHKHLVLMKGRGSYPCYPNPDTDQRVLDSAAGLADSALPYDKACSVVASGRSPPFEGISCADGPCTKDKSESRRVYKACIEATDAEPDGKRPCPYRLAVGYANANNHVVHNLHGFIFQTSFAGWFSEREIMIVDECHDMVGIVRDMLTKKVRIPHVISAEGIELPELSDPIEKWVEFLSQPNICPREGSTEHKEYFEALDLMIKYQLKDFVVDVDEDPYYSNTKLTFIPKNIGNAAEALILRYGKRRLLMSGTIYDKEDFCRRNGLKSEETYFIRLESSFPTKNRPIIMKDRLMVDTSFKMMDENFPQLIENMKHVLNTFPDKRGLIHAPSYAMSYKIAAALGSERVISHEPENFMSQLNYFLTLSQENAVFISPTCQQGVDLKDDRARFQMIVRVPFLSSQDPLVKSMLEDRNFSWYNLQALIVFGQMLGRPVRSDKDWGYTILLDSRFKSFINSNRRYLPRDVLKCVITK